MTLQAGKALKMGLALWAALALAGCASSVQRSEEHRAATFKVSAEYPIGAVNVSATPEALAKILRSDLSWGGLNASTADPAEYLKGLFLPPDEATELRRIQALLSPERERAAIALARKLDRESLFAVYQQEAIPELRSRRLGCIVHQPEYAGVDLAALCLRDERD